MKKGAPTKRPARRVRILAFWDTSALVPVCCLQPQSRHARHAGRLYKHVVWWGTAVEMLSALLRGERRGRLSANEAAQAIDRLQYMRREWHEIEPSESVRSQAERMLRIHDL